MRKLTVRLRRSETESLTIGELAEHERTVYFEYSAEFLSSGLQLSPFKLPARRGLLEHQDRSFGPLAGLFDDSLPDGWGLLLVDRHFRKCGVRPQTVSALDRLAWLGTKTMGALTYHPPDMPAADAMEVDLGTLSKNAEEVLEGDAAEVLPQLLRTGGSPGGARPKVLVGVKNERFLSGEEDLPAGYGHWMVKFAGKSETRDAGPIEHAYALMAGAAGIDMPEVRLFQVDTSRRHFGVRRFDRLPGNRRVHVHTLGGLIHSNFRIPSLDYADLLKVTRTLTRKHGDLLRAYRRMVFNICAHVRDDHAKNFAFMMDDDGQWTLTPAYDLTWSQGPGGEHTMTVQGEGMTPTREHCMALAKQFGLSPRDQERIFSEVNEATSAWSDFAAESSCSEEATAKVAEALSRI